MEVRSELVPRLVFLGKVGLWRMHRVVGDGQVVDHGDVLYGRRPRVVNRLGKAAAPAPVVVHICCDDHDSKLKIEEVAGIHR